MKASALQIIPNWLLRNMVWRSVAYLPEVALAVLVCVGLSSFVVAQPANYGKNPPGNRVEVAGTLKAWQGNMLQIVNKEGQMVAFQIPDRPGSVKFKGKYKFESLTRGMMVRVDAPAAGGQFLEPFKSIEVFVPDQSKMTARSSPNDQSLNVPGIYPVSMLSRQIPGSTPSPNIRVVGSIVNSAPSKLALQCGPKSITLDLADPVTVDFTASNLQFARQGDQVKATGYYNPATGQFSASSMEVNGVKPLGIDPPPQAVMPPEGMKLRVKEKSKSKSKKESPMDAPENPEALPALPALSSEVPAPKPE